ncbi:SUKH-3 domain-containing protein [Paractinoplanes durhamensis]|uniref:SUKH-3 immunity protein of toxin-antitoxin system n=1 Tax=Paractinoplanes durhamensis TaxID=113563 RepID=A0ABQ3YNZ0_9ACTN|nr:SUKH-3 domain-containing protein [Actinoplanes durhamensis]GID99255.1 hypothetical protein Adu01nite_06060 [Actinoplanes durhamensis]
MAQRFPRRVGRRLRRSGWFPGRQVDIAPWRGAVAGVEMHPAAVAFLAEFGGLTVGVRGLGWGRTAMQEPFELDPTLCVGEDDRFVEWGEFLGRPLFPLGELDHGRFLLGMAEDGAIYLVSDWLGLIEDGPADAALTALCQGTMARELRAGRRA